MVESYFWGDFLFYRNFIILFFSFERKLSFVIFVITMAMPVRVTVIMTMMLMCILNRIFGC